MNSFSRRLKAELFWRAYATDLARLCAAIRHIDLKMSFRLLYKKLGKG